MTEFLSQYGVMIVSLVAAGLFAGLVAGLFGIGGGAVIVPVLFFLLDGMGYSETAMHVAVATSLATIILTSARSVMAHHKHGAVDWGIIRGWAPWIMLGAVCGIGLSGFMSKRMLLGLFGTLLLLLAAQIAFGRPNWRLAERMPEGAGRAGAGAGVGTLSALMGIGGGTFGVSLMTLFGVPIHRAVATAAGWGVAIGLPGAIAAVLVGWGREGLPPMSAGFVNLPAFLLISTFTVLMAPVGASLAHKLNADRLRKLFGGLLVLVAVRMVWQAAGI
ncbi:sulfite exporter TauE/SafE family protein [Hyphomonas sp.]|uniref:sulfite exporter TauE/SafE family protein n=1 Tax=Hyphomonas sp. TaxID=87 RepID=UPI00391CE5E0